MAHYRLGMTSKAGSPREVSWALGPVIYINDLPDVVLSTIFLFADDTKLYRRIIEEQDRQLLQSDVHNIDRMV